MKKIKVLIADDHSVVRDGLCLLLAEAEDMEVVAQAEDGAKAVAQTKKHQPDVVLMDLSMPVMDGMEATRQIRLNTPSCKVLVLSSYSEDKLVERSIENGATGFLLKQSAARELLSGIREATKGRAVFSSSIAKRLANLKRRFPVTQREQKASNHLTKREHEVLQLISQGVPNKQIADVLRISIKT